MKQLYAALLITFGISATAHADSWIYTGISIHSANLNSDSAAGYSMHAGTGILPLIGIEGGVVRHGDFSLADKNQDLTSYYAGLKPSIDIANFHIYAKVGAHIWRDSLSSNDGLDLFRGVGLEYFVIDNLSLGASLTDYSFDDSNSQSYAITATLHFL